MYMYKYYETWCSTQKIKEKGLQKRMEMLPNDTYYNARKLKKIVFLATDST